MRRPSLCPRCAGCVTPGTLEGKGRYGLWTILPAIRCLNCGWYGGEETIDAHHRMGVTAVSMETRLFI